MIPLCGGASAAEGETAFSKDPGRSETISLQQPREVGQAGDEELKVPAHTHPICLEYLGYPSPGHWSNTSKTCSLWLLCLKHPIQTIKIKWEGLFCSQSPPLKQLLISGVLPKHSDDTLGFSLLQYRDCTNAHSKTEFLLSFSIPVSLTPSFAILFCLKLALPSLLALSAY